MRESPDLLRNDEYMMAHRLGDLAWRWGWMQSIRLLVTAQDGEGLTLSPSEHSHSCLVNKSLLQDHLA